MEYSGLLSSTGIYAIYALLPLGLLYAVYALWFHPLREHPGPVLGRITNAYAAFFALNANIHLKTHENFEKYDIYLNPKVTKGRAYTAIHNRAKFPSLTLAVDRAQHRRKRKLIAPSISERSMRSFEPTMSAMVDTFLRQVLTSSRENAVVDISERSKCLGIDVVGMLAFGHNFNMQRDSTNRYFYQLMESMGWRFNAYMQFSPFRLLEHVLAILRAKQLIRFDSALKAVIQKRMSQDKKAHHDLYSMIADDMYEGELWPESVFFLGAGGLTTATTLSATFFYLSRSCNSKAYATLAAEIRSTFNSADEICAGPLLSGCKYLRACIDEALRLSPPFLASSWRELDKSESGPFMVDGHVIPRGTQVAVSIYSVLHNEDYFPDAYSFTPERWLPPADAAAETEADKTARANMRKAFIPFLAGDRGCAGKSMAYMELSLALARTLWYFDFEPAQGKAGEAGGGTAGCAGDRGRLDEYQLGDMMVTTHHGPNLLFHTRGENWKGLVNKE